MVRCMGCHDMTMPVCKRKGPELRLPGNPGKWTSSPSSSASIMRGTLLTGHEHQRSGSMIGHSRILSGPIRTEIPLCTWVGSDGMRVLSLGAFHCVENLAKRRLHGTSTPGSLLLQSANDGWTDIHEPSLCPLCRLFMTETPDGIAAKYESMTLQDVSALSCDA